MSPTIDGHTLERKSNDCWLCSCGYAVFGAPDDRAARVRWRSFHIDEVKRHRAHIKEAQKEKRQSDFADAQADDPFSPFRSPVTGGGTRG